MKKIFCPHNELFQNVLCLREDLRSTWTHLLHRHLNDFGAVTHNINVNLIH